MVRGLFTVRLSPECDDRGKGRQGGRPAPPDRRAAVRLARPKAYRTCEVCRRGGGAATARGARQS